MTKLTTMDAEPSCLHYPRYAENGSIRSWGALAISLGAPIAALVMLIVAATNNVEWWLVPGFACIAVALTSVGFWACWSVGIRIDETGIRIGGCKRTSRWWWHAWERIRRVSGPSSTRPNTYTLFVPWNGIKAIQVATKRKHIHQVIRDAPKRTLGGRRSGSTPRYFYRVGVIMPLYATLWCRQAVRGFLLFDIDVNQAQVPAFRSPSRQYAMPPFSIWMCPTRKPKKLQKIVDELQPLLNR